MAKNLVWGPILAPLSQIWAPNFFSWILLQLDVRHCCKLYHYIQFQGKLMNQTWENDKKNLVSGPILAILAQI